LKKNSDLEEEFEKFEDNFEDDEVLKI